MFWFWAQRALVNCFSDYRSFSKWIEKFMRTGSDVDALRSRSSRTAKTPENVVAVRESFLQSNRSSTRKHAMAFRLFARTVSQVCHLYLKLYPYKMMVLQELFSFDFRKLAFCQDSWMSLQKMLLCSLVMKPVFINRIVSRNKTCVTGQRVTPVNSRKAFK